MSSTPELEMRMYIFDNMKPWRISQQRKTYVLWHKRINIMCSLDLINMPV